MGIGLAETFGVINIYFTFRQAIITTMIMFTVTLLLVGFLENVGLKAKRVKFNKMTTAISRDLVLPLAIGILLYPNIGLIPFSAGILANVFVITFLLLGVYILYCNFYYHMHFGDVILKNLSKMIFMVKLPLIYMIASSNLWWTELFLLVMLLIGLRIFDLMNSRWEVKSALKSNLKDQPITEVDDLFPQRKNQLSVVADQINRSGYSFSSYAITGKWGYGKTSFLNALVKELENRPLMLQGKKVVEKPKIIRINPNIDSSFDSMIQQLFGQLKEIMADSGIYTGFASTVSLYERVIEDMLSEEPNGIIKLLFKLLKSNSHVYDMRGIKENLEKEIMRLTERDLKLLIIIDDLDRCGEETVMETLKFLTSVFEIDGCSLVFLLDRDMMANENYYFDKYINESIELSELNSDEVLRHYLDKSQVLSEMDLMTEEHTLVKFQQFLASNDFSIEVYKSIVRQWYQTKESDLQVAQPSTPNAESAILQLMSNPRRIKIFIKTFFSLVRLVDKRWFGVDGRESDQLSEMDIFNATFQLAIVKTFFEDEYEVMGNGSALKNYFNQSKLIEEVFSYQHTLGPEKIRFLSVLVFSIHCHPELDLKSVVNLSKHNIQQGIGTKVDYEILGDSVIRNTYDSKVDHRTFFEMIRQEKDTKVKNESLLELMKKFEDGGYFSANMPIDFLFELVPFVESYFYYFDMSQQKALKDTSLMVLGNMQIEKAKAYNMLLRMCSISAVNYKDPFYMSSEELSDEFYSALATEKVLKVNRRDLTFVTDYIEMENKVLRKPSCHYREMIGSLEFLTFTLESICEKDVSPAPQYLSESFDVKLKALSEAMNGIDQVDHKGKDLLKVAKLLVAFSHELADEDVLFCTNEESIDAMIKYFDTLDERITFNKPANWHRALIELVEAKESFRD